MYCLTANGYFLPSLRLFNASRRTPPVEMAKNSWHSGFGVSGAAAKLGRAIGVSAGTLIGFVLIVAATAPAGAAAPRLEGLLHNEDCTQIFMTQKFLTGKAGDVIDRYVDVMADAGVTVFLCNTNARRTNYQSGVWESFWSGFDPAGPDEQPFLAPVPRSDVANFRTLIANMRAVHEEGIDYPARVIERCRQRQISPWITLRMNDCHYNDIPDHPFHGSFWKNNPQLRRQNYSGYFATCLDYAQPEVRNYFKALIQETLDRYDVDGLELDFMREPFLFSSGSESQGATLLTAWLREVRGLVDQAATRRGHPISLGVRVPSRPQTAMAWGLDAPTWSQEGLVDLLVATPRWSTLEVDMPLGEWRRLIDASRTTLAGGLEVRYQPYRGAAAGTISPELARGAAVCALSGGADVVYLFNYFQGTWPAAEFQQTLQAMKSIDSLLALPRSVAVTYRDITSPGESYQAPLPKTGKELAVDLKLGPVPESGWACTMTVGLAATPGQSTPAPAVSVNGVPCESGSDETSEGGRFVSYNVPRSALVDTLAQAVKIVSRNQQELTLQRAELSLKKAP